MATTCDSGSLILNPYFEQKPLWEEIVSIEGRKKSNTIIII